MDRLTYKITNIQTGNVLSYGLNSGCNMMLKGIQKLGAYEDADEQGLLLRLPVPEGTEVYVIVEAYSFGEVGDEAEKWFSIHKDKFSRNMIEEFGKTVFLTREEAEQALKQMGE